MRFASEQSYRFRRGRAIRFFRFDFRDGVAPHHVPAKILAPLVKTLQLETCCNPGADESHAVRALATPEAFFLLFYET